LDIVETPQGQVDSTHDDNDLGMVNVSLTIGVLQQVDWFLRAVPLVSSGSGLAYDKRRSLG
jgi:hypothetical protein